MSVRILHVDDDQRFHRIVQAILQKWKSVELVSRDQPAAAMAAVRQQAFHIGLIDLEFIGANSDGFQLIEHVRSIDPKMEIIVVSGVGSFAAVQRALRAGANDYVQKGFSPDELIYCLERAMGRMRLRSAERMVKDYQSRDTEIVGDALATKNLIALIRKFAPKEAPVLVEGETGAGKELVARALHANSKRFGGPFVPVDCGAIPASLAESYLFGHQKGAFTGADRDHIGALEQADGGTLFLDEINSLSSEIQTKLLRALQEKEIRRVGSPRSIQLDFRIITACNENLESLVREKKFREDLLYRIQVLKIEVPPLRKRLDDLYLLAEAFLPARKIHEDVWSIFLSYEWPGNVREFKSCLNAMDAIADPSEILVKAHIPERILKQKNNPQKVDLQIPINEFKKMQARQEKEYLSNEYKLAKKSVSKLARALGVDRSYLHEKLVRLGIHKPRA